MTDQKVWPDAKVTITWPDGATAFYDKVRFLALPGEPLRVMSSTGYVLAEFIPDSENEVSDKLSVYSGPGESWSVQNTQGCGCGK